MTNPYTAIDVLIQVFAVFREGVYRHECCGIFTDKDKAIACADAAADADGDSWHEYRVYPFTLNVPTPMGKYFSGVYSPSVDEADAVYSIKKSNLKKHEGQG